MKNLGGKTAVITGAATGIGRALALRCAGAGMRVVLADVDEAALEATRGELGELGAEAIAVPTDVSSPERMEELARKAVETFGAVHLLCNNAGVAFGTSVWETSLDDWRWVLGVNLWGVVHGVRIFMPILLEQGGEAHIVNTASIQGLITHHALSAPYQVSKHAVVSLSEQLRFELARRGAAIGVSVLCPGWARTRIGESGRLRPAAGCSPEAAVFAPEQEEAYEHCMKAVENGADPDEVAARTLEAVRENRFYVLPHPEWKARIRDRMEGILDERAPDTTLY